MEKTVLRRVSMFATVVMLICIMLVAASQISVNAAGYVFQEDFGSTSNNGYVWGGTVVVKSASVTGPVNGWSGSANTVTVYATTSPGYLRTNCGSTSTAVASHSFTRGTGGDVTVTGAVSFSDTRFVSIILYNGTTKVAQLLYKGGVTGTPNPCAYMDGTTERTFSANGTRPANATSAYSTFKIVLKWDGAKFASADYYINNMTTPASLAVGFTGSLANATQTNVDKFGYGEGTQTGTGANLSLDDIKIYTAGTVTLPSVSAANITGVQTDGQLLTASYTWGGEFSDLSTIQWQQADAVEGPYTDIGGATLSTYTLTSAQIDKFVRYQITPKDNAGNSETAEISFSTGAIQALSSVPTATVPAITGTPRTGEVLTADYTYEGDPQGASILQWQVSDSAGGTYTDIAGANSLTYTPTSAQTTKYLKFKVTPKDINGIAGAPQISDATAQVTGTLLTPNTPTATGKVFSWANVPGASSVTLALSKTGVGVVHTYTDLVGTSQDCTTEINANGGGEYTVTVQAIGDGIIYLNSAVSGSFAKTWYSVTYNANNGAGSVPVDSNVYSYGTNYIIKGNIGDPILTRIGYAFNGWNTKADGTGTDRAIGASVSMGNTANVIIYAKWLVVIDKTALGTAITDATTLLNSKTVGTEIGNVPQSAKDAFQTAITIASAVNADANATQAAVDAQVTALATATTAFNNAIIVPVDKSALTTAISDATTLVNSKTVGTDIGNVPQSAKDAFDGAILAATTVFDDPDATQAQVDEQVSLLATATIAFNSAVIVPIEKAALTTAISDATILINSKTVGADVGNVPQSAKDTFDAAISTATTVNEDPAATQAQVDEQVSLLAAATIAFNNAVIVPIEKTALSTAITDANTLIDSKTVGTDIGNVPQSAKDTFSAAILAATAIFDDPAATQAQVDDAVTTLASATDAFNYSVIGVVDKAVLTTAINDATTLLNSKTVGTDNGNVPQFAKDTFQAVINAASTVLSNVSATQAQVDAQVTALASVTIAFNNAVITKQAGFIFQENFNYTSNNGYAWGTNPVILSNLVPTNGWTVGTELGVVTISSGGTSQQQARVNSAIDGMTKAYHSFINGTGGDVTFTGSAERTATRAASFILYAGTTQIAKIRFPNVDGGSCSYFDNTNTERTFLANANVKIGSNINAFKIVLKWDAVLGAYTSAEYYFNDGILSNTPATLAADTVGSINIITSTSVDKLAFGESVEGANLDWDDFTIYVNAPVNNIPKANFPTITGRPAISQILTINYTYSGDFSELGTTVQWQQADPAVGTFTDIAGATSNTFVPTIAQSGQLLRCQITPRDNAGNTGTLSYSASTAEVMETLYFPSATVNAISGTPRTEEVLTVAYTYSGHFAEEASLMQWQVAVAPTGTFEDIAEATLNVYVPTSEQTGKYIRCIVTPRDIMGTLGTPQASLATAIVTGTLATPNAPTRVGKAYSWVRVPSSVMFKLILTKVGVGIVHTYTDINGTTQDCTTEIDAFGAGTYQASVQAVGIGDYLDSLPSFPYTFTWYAVTYFANGAEGLVPVDPNTYSQGQHYNVLGNINDPMLTKEGYTFSGWSQTDEYGTTTYPAVGASITMGTNNINLYATWALNTLTVSYDANGGEGTQVDTNLYAANVSEVTAQGADGFTKEGYTLSGWVEQGTGTTHDLYSKFIIGSSNVTLLAQWSANASLDNLTISTGELTPIFDTGTVIYTLDVPSDILELTVTPTGSAVISYITVNGTIVASGTASQGIPLNVGSNIITIEATAQNYTVKVYTIDVTRETPPVSKAQLVTAINDATTLMNSKTVGTAVGNVPQSAKDDLTSALLFAEFVRDYTDVTQEQVDEQVSALLTATTAFNNAIILPDKTALTTAIDNATALIGSKSVGTLNGNVPQQAMDDFQAAITSATTVKDDEAATQEQINEQVTALSTATTAFNNAIILITNGEKIQINVTETSKDHFVAEIKAYNIDLSAYTYVLAFDKDAITLADASFVAQNTWLAGTTSEQVDTVNAQMAVFYSQEDGYLMYTAGSLASSILTDANGTVLQRVYFTRKVGSITEITTSSFTLGGAALQGVNAAPNSVLLMDANYIEYTGPAYAEITVTLYNAQVDKAALTSAIADATTLIGSKTVGSENGNVPQSAKDDFQAAITAATVVAEDANATQEQVDGEVTALDTATTAFNNAVIVITTYNVTGTVSIIAGADFTKVSVVAKQAGVTVATANVLANGTFTIALAPGTYNFEIVRTGYITKKINSFDVTTNASQTLSAVAIKLTPGDVNASSGVNLTDLQTILNTYGANSPGAAYRAAYDLNDDGKINLVDLQAVLNNYGANQ